MWRIVLSYMALVGLVGTASGELILVAPDGSGDYPNLYEAIVAAADGDTIALEDGVFSGPGNRELEPGSKDLVIMSLSDNPKTCLIDGEQAFRAFRLDGSSSSELTIQGIGMINGTATFFGGAIYLTGWSRPVIKNCFFYRNITPSNGGAICVTHASPSIVGCEFRENVSLEQQGGAISFTVSNYSSIIDCEFYENEARYGGGLQLQDCDTFVSGCYFEGNMSENYGAGLKTVSGDPTITDCVFVGNHSDMWFGGMHVNDATVTNCLFLENTAGVVGGALGVFGSESDPLISDCVFIRNSAPWAGGIDSWESHPTIRNCTLVGNSASEEGAGIYSAGEDPGSVIVENTIVAFSPDGEAVMVDPGNSMTLICCDLYGNVDGDWIETVEDQYGINGNISENPLFCDVSNDSLKLHEGSPCAPNTPPNPECDLIGALPTGCAFQAVDDSWFAEAGSELRVASPSRGFVHLQMTNPTNRTAFARIEAFDLSGRRVADVFEGMITPGSHRLDWDGIGSDGSSLRNGVYLLQLSVEGEVTGRGRAIILR